MPYLHLFPLSFLTYRAPDASPVPPDRHSRPPVSIWYDAPPPNSCLRHWSHTCLFRQYFPRSARTRVSLWHTASISIILSVIATSTNYAYLQCLLATRPPLPVRRVASHARRTHHPFLCLSVHLTLWHLLILDDCRLFCVVYKPL